MLVPDEMEPGRATLVAALAVYPPALAFFASRALMRGNHEELYAVVVLVPMLAVASVPFVWLALAVAVRSRFRERPSQTLFLGIAYAIGVLLWFLLPPYQRQAFSLVFAPWLLLIFSGLSTALAMWSRAEGHGHAR